MRNTLYYGDNLEILRKHIPDESVDLIYLDPPFNSNRDYNVIFKEATGEESEAQLRAFSDSWHWTPATQRTLEELAECAPSKLVDLINGFINVLGHNDVTAYLVMMAIRLVELHRVLKPTGSLYLHCDPTCGHYLKIIMDIIFGKRNFRNEIIWHYRKWPSGWRQFQRNHDTIFFYSKSDDEERPFNKMFMPRAESTLKRFGKARIVSGYDEKGKRLPSRTEETESEGVPLDDVWDIGRVPPIKQLFPTQKPDSLLERIIQASSNEGDLVLDPFCGCGTTIIAAQKLKRRWIGIDITHLAISLMKYRLHDTFGDDVQYEVIGEPVDTQSARALAEQDRYQFQWWALSLIKARPVSDEKKKGADAGIDGTLYFIDDAKTPPKKIIVQVKSGKVQVRDIRELIQVVHRTKATMGFFITLEEPTDPMLKEALAEGLYKSPGWVKQYQKIQIRTIAQLLAGEDFDMPPTNVSFKRAEKARQTNNEHEKSLLDS
jgi:site-specific DNA-methyltransferase (adenine-specific)